MKEYRITHKEELIGYYYIEAQTEAEALEKFSRMAANGEINFSDMEMTDSSDIVDTV